MSKDQDALDRRRTQRARELGCDCRWEGRLLISCPARLHPWRARPAGWDGEMEQPREPDR